ncbi:MAG: Transferase hexapeptide repeat protein [candidate division TM6 bacterium GW2011_GWF2_36_6]|nr:MAG: Transferase hexapeptide repeat protein [candidate division TM6 bacterium GW2011_GWF2_36_6]
MNDIIIVGAGGHAKVIIDAIEKENKKKIIGIINKTHTAQSFLGYPILGGDSFFEKHLPTAHVIIAIGDNYTRAITAAKIKHQAPMISFTTVIHPCAIIAKNVTIGPGSFIAAGVIINTETTIGNHCIINTAATIDHENIIEHFVSIAPGCTTGGKVHVKEGSFLGLGSKIIHNITIEKHAIIGAGAVVIKDVAPNTLMVGVPAQQIRQRKDNEPYL